MLSGVFLLLIPVTWQSQWCAKSRIELQLRDLLFLPAVYTSEEDGLAFIRRSHLPGVINHAFFIAASAASVDLRKRTTTHTGIKNGQKDASLRLRATEDSILPQAPSFQSYHSPPDPQKTCPVGWTRPSSVFLGLKTLDSKKTETHSTQ